MAITIALSHISISEEYRASNFSTDVSMEELNQQFLSFDVFRKNYLSILWSLILPNLTSEGIALFNKLNVPK